MFMNVSSLAAMTLPESTGEGYHDILPLTKTEPFEFTADTAETERLISGLHLAHYATAANCYDNMIGAYDLQAYSADRMLQRKIMGVRYTMAMKDFSIINPYTFAEDISIQTVQKIKEASGVLPGITVETGAVREYPLPEVAPYIIGSIGPIYAEEWETLKDDNYQLSAKVGKAGKLFGKFRVVRRLLFVEPKVLQQHYLPVFHRVYRRLRLRPDAILRERHFCIKQLIQPRRHRRKRIFRLYLSLGAAQV